MARYRKEIQIATLILFVILLKMGKIQLWMGIFFISLLFSILFGRFYCGYICPINTVMEIMDTNVKKNKKIRKKVPELLKQPWIRYSILILFICTMIFIFKTRRKLPVLPVLFLLGVILTVFFEPSLWHRYLCPYGSMLSIFSKKSKGGYTISDDHCIKCGLCVRNCPSDAIYWENKSKYPIILKNECILCSRCKQSCSTEAIK